MYLFYGEKAAVLFGEIRVAALSVAQQAKDPVFFSVDRQLVFHNTDS